jgi:iron complex transport system substrate-binding protein
MKLLTQLSLQLPRRAVLQRSMVFASTSLLGASSALVAPLTWAQSAAPLPRLVTLGGAITELAYLLGVQEQLVGTDTTSTYPEAALRTAKVGYMRQLSAEGLLSLKPQAVIATTEAGPPVVIDQIRSAGVKVELIEADHTWGEVQRKLQAVGHASGHDVQARTLQTKLDDQWIAAQSFVAQSKGKKPRVLFILAHSQSPSVSGEKTAADALIRMIGGINAMGGANSFNGYRPMTAEAMASAAPDIILTSSQGIDTQGGADKFWTRPELVLTPAFKRKALVHMDAMKMLGFGPRLPEAVRELHQKVVLA